MLLRSSRLHYPVTVIRLYVDGGQDVTKAAPLFEYNYKAKNEEVDEFGETTIVERSYNADFVAPVEGNIAFWKIRSGTVITQDGTPLVEIEEPCLHEVQFAGMCAVCGKDMTEVDFASTVRDTDRANVNIAHGSTELRVSHTEASRISEESRKRLLAGRKLSLVVDLDQTIIHATVDPTVGEWQRDEDNPNYEAVKDVRSFQLVDDGPGGRGSWYYIKLRPGLAQFLESVSEHYELHIYTMATRAYAQNIAKIVDPERKIFADRIISRDENGSMTVKNLHRLFPVDTKMVAIIDDRADVWQWSDNLIKVNAYDFFVGIGDINSSFLPKKEVLQLEAKSVQARKEAEKSHEEDANDDSYVEQEQDGTSAKGDEELSAIEQQLVAMAGRDDARNLEELSTEQEHMIEQQKESTPLKKMQEKIDKILDEETFNTSDTGEENQLGHVESSRPRHNLLHDDDVELERLGQTLMRVHKTFYDEYDRKLAGSHGGRIAELRGGKGTKRKASEDVFAVPDIKELMPRMKEETLRGVVLVFSGVVPLNVDVQVSDIALWAKSFGARVDNNITSATTHVVATRQRKTHKVKQAASQPHIKIVVTDWLVEAFSTWKKPDEEPYKIEVEPEESGFNGVSDDKDLINSLEHADDILSGTDEDDMETDATGTETEHDNEHASVDYDDEEAQRSPVDDVTNDDWEAMNKEIEAELGSDYGDSDEDSYQSDASDASHSSRGSRRSAASAEASRKRKRTDSSAENSENESGDDKATTSWQGSNLQRRKKKALERVSSLTNVATADSSGLPSPDTTGPEEAEGSLQRVGGAPEENIADFDENDLEAEFEKEFENAGGSEADDDERG